jgi:hypothetical protein
MICIMSEPRFDLPVMIRTTPRAKLALDRVVAAVRASDRARWKRKRATQEAVFSAVWLWLEDMGEAEVVDAMARYLPRLEAIMNGGEASPANGPVPIDGPPDTIKAPPPRRVTVRGYESPTPKRGRKGG